MHFLRTLVLSTLYASAAFAVTIPGGSCGGKKDIEVTININHEQALEQSVFSMINSPP